MGAPELSVVIPVYNAATTIDSQLGALATQRDAPAWELIIADNGSTDGTNERIDRWRYALPNLRVIDASQKRGPACARNVGIKASRTRVWAACDADDVVSPHWVSAMAHALRSHEFVTGPLDDVSLNLRSAVRERHPTSDGTPRIFSDYLPFAPTSNVGATRELFDRIGGFNDSLWMGEDVDFSWRAQLSGATLIFDSRAVIAYRHRERSRDEWRQIHSYARARVEIFRRYRAQGMPRRPTSLVSRQWAWLLTRSPMLIVPGKREFRGEWLRMSAKATGHLRGSVEARVLYL